MSDQKIADNVMQEMFGVFNKKAEDVNFVNEEETGSIFFKPDSKKSPGQVFRGIVKFMPNLHDLNNMTVKKVSYWVPEGVGKGFRYDSAKSLGKYEDCPAANVYWALKGSKDPRVQARGKQLVYSRKTYALIQVIKDLTNPENDGKLMLWDLPTAIQRKIKAQMYPSKEDIDMGAIANNIFDPINGFAMNLKIPIKTVMNETTKKTDEYRDYDECQFIVTKPVLMILAGEKTPMVLDPAKAQEQQKQMIETILAGPNLQDYAYKPATPEQLTRLNAALSALSGGQIDQPATNAEPAKTVPAATDAQTATGTQPATDAKVDESAKQAENTASNAKTEAKTEPAKTEPAASAETQKPAATDAGSQTDQDAELLKQLGLDT